MAGNIRKNSLGFMMKCMGTYSGLFRRYASKSCIALTLAFFLEPLGEI